MNALQIPPDNRPDIVAMAGPDYDIRSETPAAKTLIICSAPRTGSYELCRLLMAAGIGIPHEYFHHQFAPNFGARFGVEGNPLDRPNVRSYIEALRRNRGQNGVLAVNIQHWQLSRFLINPAGRSLFENAAVVHLFRPDIGNQVTSWRVAMNTGIWDYSRLRTSPEREYPADLEERAAQYQKDLKFIAGEDAGFREFFALAGIEPFFVLTDTLFAAPKEIVRLIGEALQTPINEEALDAMLARSERYPRDEAAYRRATEDLAPILRRKAFGD